MTVDRVIKQFTKMTAQLDKLITQEQRKQDFLSEALESITTQMTASHEEVNRASSIKQKIEGIIS